MFLGDLKLKTDIVILTERIRRNGNKEYCSFEP